MSGLDYAIVALFLVVMALAGMTISRLIRDSDDFFVAGRELTPFILCATITATNLSMFHFIGMGGTAYQSGLSIGWQNRTGCIALVLSGLFVVPILRRLRIRSVPEFLEMRYGRGLRTLIGAFWGLRLCVYLGILLYLAATAAVTITGHPQSASAYVMWLLAFAVVSILYSAIGGAWAVAIMDSVQFAVMLGGALIVLPITTRAAGGVPAIAHYLRSVGQSGHLALVPSSGEFDWLFICAILLLGFKWATVDQAILQRAFGARTPRISAQGMVLSAVITTIFPFFWILPGLAAARLHPGFSNPDEAIPWLLATQVPAVARGLLGIVLCGLIAAQVSAVTSDINSVATLFTSDVYRSFWRRELSQRHLLIVVRISSIFCGALMLLVAWYLRGNGAGAVRANLTVVGILDMPLFVITIVYGLLWKRANWQGAIAGFIGGGLLGILTHFLVTEHYFQAYLHPAAAMFWGEGANILTRWHEVLVPHQHAVRNIVPFISTGAALVITPLVSMLTTRSSRNMTTLWASFRSDSVASEVDTFHVIPTSPMGRVGVGVVFIGFAVFIFGVISASWHFAPAGELAVGGMLAVLAGGLLRAFHE